MRVGCSLKELYYPRLEQLLYLTSQLLLLKADPRCAQKAVYTSGGPGFNVNPLLSVNSPGLGSTVRLRISMEPGFCVRLEGTMGVRCLASEEDHLGEVDGRGEEDHTKKKKRNLPYVIPQALLTTKSNSLWLESLLRTSVTLGFFVGGAV